MKFFKQNVEASVDLRHVTHGTIVTSRKQYDPESGKMKFTLQLGDEGWNPRQGFEKWNSATRTFTDVCPLKNIIDIWKIHKVLTCV